MNTVLCPSGLPRSTADALETEVFRLRQQMAVFYAATMGALAMSESGSEIPSTSQVDESLPFGLRNLMEEIDAATHTIVDLAFGKGDTEAP
jgi:hypothetical protein